MTPKNARITCVRRYGNRYVQIGEGIGEYHLYPTMDIAELTMRVKQIIGKIEEDAYRRGFDDSQKQTRRALGIPEDALREHRRCM